MSFVSVSSDSTVHVIVLVTLVSSPFPADAAATVVAARSGPLLCSSSKALYAGFGTPYTLQAQATSQKRPRKLSSGINLITHFSKPNPPW